MTKPARVLLAGGGSAGHVSPMLALADCLRRRDPATVIAVVGTETGLEARLVPARGYPLHFVPKVPMPRRPGAELLRVGPQLRAAATAASQAITQTQAEVVVGFGGYVCPPVYLAARRLGVPIVIHEQNPLPGLANRLGARLTRHVATTFADTPLAHAVQVGLPLGREISELGALTPGERAKARLAARLAFGLEPSRTTLLVTGGSLGAQRLNQTFGAVQNPLRAAGIQVLHISGESKEFAVEAGKPPYVVRPYVERMAQAYLAADFVVCRAGASTVWELAAAGLPAAYVPLPIGNGEQRRNAEPMVAGGGGLLVDDADCGPAWVEHTLIPLVTDRTRLVMMGQKAQSLMVPDADERLADLVLAARGAR